jgi:flagellar hook-associated protein 2
MAFGALSSLGAGSGVLTYDVIDKLKKADTTTMVTPFQTRMKNVENQQKQLSALTTQINLFKSSISDFKDGEIFQKRLANVSGSSVSADVTPGVAVQKISMDVTQLAQNDIYQSNGFDSETTTINNSGNDQTLKFSYAGQEHDITLKDGATLSDLRDSINDANIGVTASIIDTGSDTNPYKLIIKGNKTGKDNIIKLDYGNIDDLGFNQKVYQSKQYSADTDEVNNSGATQTFKVSINGTDYSMDVADQTQVKDFINNINNGNLKDSNGNSLAGISAEYDNGYIKLHLQDIGDISIIDDNLTSAMNDNTNDTNDNRVQQAQNSIFKYNGTEVTRDSNKIDDLVVGLTMDLNSTGTSTIDISQDTDTIKKTMKDFVSGYNSIVSKIQDLTKYDPDSKTAGVFQNESAIRNIPNDLQNALFSTFLSDTTTKKDRNGQEYDQKITLSATDFGFSMNRTGFLDFDSSKFDKMLKDKPDKVEKFLSGDDGAMTKILNNIDRLTKGPNATLNLLNTEYKNEQKSFQKTIDDAKKRIDTKYQIMAEQFASYDSMINSYNVQSQTIQQSIQAMLNAKK